MTDSRSPRVNPSAARPRAKSRTWSWYSRHVKDCQIPRSFSRMAVREACSRARCWSSRGIVSASVTGASGGSGLGLSQIRLDDEWVRADLVGRALGDLAAHVEHGDAIRDVHDHAHVVLDQDDRGAPL